MNAELAAVIAQLAEGVVKLLPNIIRAIRDGDDRSAAELARRAALAAQARAVVRRGTKGVKR